MLSKKILSTIPISVRTLRRMSAEHVDGHLTLQQLRILVMINEGMGQTQIGTTLYISPAAVSKMINCMVEKKMVSRGKGKDNRSVSLTLTSSGKKTLSKVTTQLEQKLDKNIVKLTTKEQADLDKGLAVLVKLMGLVNEK